MDFVLSVLGSIGFNWHVALANFINFLIILFILNKFVFKKVLKTVDERKSLISKGLDDARIAEKKLFAASEESAEIISASKSEGENIIKLSIDKAEASARDIAIKAEHDADVLTTNLKEKIENVNSSLLSEFKKSSPELLAKMFKKVVDENMTTEQHNLFAQKIAASIASVR